MIEVLAIVNNCSSPTLSYILDITRRGFQLIQILVPIILIISLTINISKLMANPDDKKIKDIIKNSVFATVIIFMIPILIDVTMNIMGENFTISKCWNAAKEYKKPSSSNYSGDDEERKKIINDDKNYEKSTGTNTGSNGNNSNGSSDSNGTNNSSTGNQSLSIDNVVYDLNDLTKISNATAAQLTAVLNNPSRVGKNSRNFIPFVNDFLETEHKYSINVFFLLGLNATESGWYTSSISKNCNNLGGVRSSSAHPSKGCGKNAGGSFAYFNTIGDFLDYQGSLLKTKYLTPGGKYYHGKTIEGVSVAYVGSDKSQWISGVKSRSKKIFNALKYI